MAFLKKCLKGSTIILLLDPFSTIDQRLMFSKKIKNKKLIFSRLGTRPQSVHLGRVADALTRTMRIFFAKKFTRTTQAYSYTPRALRVTFSCIFSTFHVPFGSTYCSLYSRILLLDLRLPKCAHLHRNMKKHEELIKTWENTRTHRLFSINQLTWITLTWYII